MKTPPTAAEINSLFTNSDPIDVWQKVDEIIADISPSYDNRFAKRAFDDVMQLFSGEYPGFCQIGTPYHDMQHTLDVLLCAVRLAHGAHFSGSRLIDDELTMIVMAALMHDTGYAQRIGEDCGTGAQLTQVHVSRSVEFMRQYIADKLFPEAWVSPLESIILCSNPELHISEISFPDERAKMLGEILGTADLTGQMADRTYLEKLVFLFLEFDEAQLGNYRNVHDLLRGSQKFYESSQRRLFEQFGGVNAKLSYHFKFWYGVEIDYYLESIEKNLAYLARITALNDMKHLAMLKRGGVMEKLMLPEI